MSALRYGSLFSGYAGLDMGIQSVLGGETAWFCEFDKAPSKILAHHWPDVPNLGDITTVDWSGVEPVDVLTGGSPCQDLSHAGARKGMTEGTRSNLWVAMREAVAQLRPRLVVWENVRGAYSAAADSAVEFSGRLLAPAGDGPALRALGRVLGDLSDLGYDAWWYGLRAADVGAPHGRFRVFVIAHPSAVTPDFGHERAGVSRGRWDGPAHGSLLPTPRATDGTKGGPNQRGSSGDLMLPSAVTLLPTPAVNDMGEGKTVEAWDEWTAKMQATHANGNGHGKSLAIEAQRLLPTPMTSYSQRSPDEWRAGRPAGNGQTREAIGDLEVVIREGRWGVYADAIARWEALTRPAPAPTQTSRKGTPQLSPAFSEWMMGLPAGHVTGVPGLSRNEQLKALGNGVVPQQAAAAINLSLTMSGV